MDQTINALKLLDSGRKTRFSAVSLLLWDYFITFDQEVHYVWRTPWTLTKGLFVWNRYFGILRSMADMAIFFNDKKSNLVRDFGFRWQYLSGTFAILSVEVILQLRLYVMYDSNIKLLLVTGLLCLAQLATVLGLLGKSLVAMEVSPTGKVICCTLPHTPFFGGFWGPILLFETLLFGLALRRGFQNRSEISRGFSETRRQIIESLVKHSVLYYLVIFTVFTVNFIVPFVAPRRVEYVVEFAFVLSSIMGNRILLNIQGIFKDNTDTDCEDTVLSTKISIGREGGEMASTSSLSSYIGQRRTGISMDEPAVVSRAHSPELTSIVETQITPQQSISHMHDTYSM
ncbi:hypothetical protein BD410DRAFT_542655 [Rickenella mellea]|uniref:DUF6533 domain-containing protein n=1 Tax=Rickenella mellea TaxID=50990 RepID=A0A4Y7PR60_9AGAM|nr:hypothetical protein BD410DRAFT_542655 [Rickenella mellea]